MLDFLGISQKRKQGVIEIRPEFLLIKSKDLMIRGGNFYAIWVDEKKLWSTDESEAWRLIDHDIDQWCKENEDRFDVPLRPQHIIKASTKVINDFHQYCKQQMIDNYTDLDPTLTFADTQTTRKDFASKRLPYSMLPGGDISAYDELMSVLYSPEERDKIEWAIGSIVKGDSKDIQKFIVMYGSAGTGKSTVLNIIQKLFEGYYSAFDAKALGSSSREFALEAFRTNPLVAIQHDGDLSRIEDNTRLNSVVSHEYMTVNEKYEKTHASKFRCFLFMGTNTPVKITNANSGLVRRLIDVVPTGDTVPVKDYRRLTKQINFELGAIADHCLNVYLSDPGRYDNYVPIRMMAATNDVYNFISDQYFVFKEEDSITLKQAWELYKQYCEGARVPYPLSRRAFQEELKSYFRDFKERCTLEDGTRCRSLYTGFKWEKFETPETDMTQKPAVKKIYIDFQAQHSLLDDILKDCSAQYASSSGKPTKAWDNVTTKLSDLDTNKLHYVLMPPDSNHIVVDFDIPDENGEKSFYKNLEEASKWPPTYAELSKSGAGIHLHYIYKGDVTKLSSIFAEHIEVKVFSGKSSLRRMVTKCNDLPIAEISSGLPLKEEKSVVNFSKIKTEAGLRKAILKAVNKEYQGIPSTKSNIDFIYKILNEAYADRKFVYDVSNMKEIVTEFAAHSTHQSDYCLKLVSNMEFKSQEEGEWIPSKDNVNVFFDIEVFPNLLLICWKKEGKGKKVVTMFNPSPKEVENLMKMPLIGYNCRRYDNHILYARLLGYNNEQIYAESQQLIAGNKDAFFGQAYNASKTDVYDFASSGNKMSLKKLEIIMDIHHQELGKRWDEPVPEEEWDLVAQYCINDVLATEAAFEYLKDDWVAREILASIANRSVNDTTNSLTTSIIFGSNKKPQSSFNYRNMGDVPKDATSAVVTDDMVLFTGENVDQRYTKFTSDCKPVFPGYKYVAGESTYRGETVGEGGYVYSEPGIYSNVALLDVASMHPSSIIAEELFGPEYTARFKEIVDARVEIKHGNFDKASQMLGGKLAPFLTDKEHAKSLANALKTAINSVYGLTAAHFDNPFRDPRNVDNIVAKRGALFMINLKHEVQSRGFTVAHIKTDSIKIPNATNEIIDFVMNYGRMYGYSFEHEATYDRMCLVNDAVYIAKYATLEKCEKLYGKEYMKDISHCDDNRKHPSEWTATGAQFAVPYVFKTLFSKEKIEFRDLCETKEVRIGDIYLDMNEDLEEGQENLVFVGRVGLFCPILDGKGGGQLFRVKDDKKYAITGTKGYRWLESEMVKTLKKEKDIDKGYYNKLVDAAIEKIAEFGDPEIFLSDESID